ncbi:MAG: protoglobin domain-containing protein [Bryobacterales bacterium]
MAPASIPGYAYGDPALPASPLPLDELRLLEQTVLFGDEDVRWLRAAGEALAGRHEDVLDVWYGFVASQPHLLAFFSNEAGAPDVHYLAAVRQRFGQWIDDLCNRPHDQAWLDYQHEIALRHYRTRKNATDSADAAPVVPLRYLVALTFAITATIRPFLEAAGRPADEVEKMHAAWFKAVTLSVVLWTRPYVRDSDF